MQEKLASILHHFEPISLEEMDHVALMNRLDTKFVFRSQLLPDLLHELTRHYRVLTINNRQVFRYESLYYDTPGFRFYQQHHQGKLNRYKLRFRNYVESNTTYFEIKLKNNKGRTVKKRMKVPSPLTPLQDAVADYLHKHTALQAGELEPKLWTNFHRITLVGKHHAERVTLDLDLEFRNTYQTHRLQDIVIAEVKRDRGQNSPFLALMHRHHLREGSVSKYCLGVIHLFPFVKYNLFKPKLHLLNKLIYAA